MINLPENSQTPSAGPVGDNGAAFASTFPGALPTCAPDALICPTRVDLNAHWLKRIPSYAAIAEWHALLKWLDLAPMNPALN